MEEDYSRAKHSIIATGVRSAANIFDFDARNYQSGIARKKTPP
jgi:hypothetical protein